MFRNGLEPMHILVLGVILVLLFGAKRLPDVAKSVGQSLKIFKNEIKDLRDDTSLTSDAPAPAPTPTTQTTASPQPPASPTAGPAGPVV
jgi:sec-independent protein translocase protein TatA